MIGRRQLLRMGAGLALGAGAAATGCSPGTGADPDDSTGARSQPSCVPRSALDPHGDIAGLPLVYEISRRPTTFWFDGAFHNQLTEWAKALPESLGKPADQLRTYGSWISGSGRCTSWHNAGRAFDLAQIRTADGRLVSCRHDLWSTESGAALERRLEAYSRVAASLHLRFAYVLTYLYDARHHNHIHVDNGRSGAELSTFSSRSRVQVQAVQAIATYLWRREVPITGRWDRATRTATGAILADLGLPGSLTDAGSWRGFLTGARTRGT
jgi:hypothetical protein